ncbi:PREDICTED: uncharacterized protein LOC104699365 [Camelina sativa]|uniref:Uncharacterized protein LOC104699365 n=1 Tax=Camelina sativa TaxID=90675 RepID=A0ABM0SLH2_CAMSA|nr:PREDICTED: uncharacterized protein LOC104699365 [Camelina sativa]
MLRKLVESAGLEVTAVSDWTYEVSKTEGKRYFVDLQNKSCTCNGFQKLMIPCSHALAAARVNGLYVPSLVGKMYYVTVFGDTYAELIYPVPNQGDEDVPVVVLENEFNPPTNPPGPRRRRKRRIPSTGEHVGNKRKRTAAHKCSTCGQPGHNRATCKNAIG